MNVGALKRLTFLFEGGVESAGGLIGLVIMFILLGVVLIAFAIWQIVIFFIVIAALTLFSGGAALKYLKCTYLTVPSSYLTNENLVVFFEDSFPVEDSPLLAMVWIILNSLRWYVSRAGPRESSVLESIWLL